MCGFVAIVRSAPEAVDGALLGAMNDTLRHRGPDGAGLFMLGGVGLGHRRLAIIDTSEGANQPLYSEDGSVALVFNGEIYNFRELRAQLELLGHRFATSTDSEVIVHAWEEFGEDCVGHLRGMFAFAIHDRGKNLLFLARDRVGKKPLYYVASASRFAAASEIKALRALPDFDDEVDPVALTQFVTFGYALGDRSIYRRVRKLPAGHSMRIDLARRKLEPHVRRYWWPPWAPEEGRTEESWLDELEAVLSDAVRLRMISDVPLGAFLSGGIDSSLVVALMARHWPGKVETFTIGFREGSHDESGYARRVAAELGTNHHCEVVTPRAMEILDDLVDAYDEPFMDMSAIPTYYLSRMTRRHVTVALSGDGGTSSFLAMSGTGWRGNSDAS